MGYSSWSDDAYSSLRQVRAKQSTAQVFTQSASRAISSEMSPKGVDMRESNDSDEHPITTPIIIALDVTGSMGRIPDNLARHKLGTLMNILLEHGVQGPQIMFMAVGDHLSDRFPLQIGQFESGTTELDKWLTSIYLEGGGGGQRKESYALPWLFASRHTSTQSFEKRGVKGFLFTIGDEGVHPVMSADSLKKILGYAEASDVTADDLLAEVQKTYNVFHIHADDSPDYGLEAQNRGKYSGARETIIQSWKELLGENLLIVDDNNSIPEVIASTVSILSGADINNITKRLDTKTASTVSKALAKINSDVTTQDQGVISL